MGVKGYERGFALTLLPERLDEPLRRNRPTVYFVNSMSDLFHEKIPDTYIRKVFRVIEQAPQHTFQILTKRAKRMSDFMGGRIAPKNAWLGVTVENRTHGLPRIDLLRTVEARIRFLSIEPLLEDLGEIDLTGIHWVIVGGESGVQARPMRPEWVTSVQRQCQAQRVAFFFKQWGGWGPDGAKRGKKRNGRLLEGRTWDGVPEALALVD